MFPIFSSISLFLQNLQIPIGYNSKVVKESMAEGYKP